MLSLLKTRPHILRCLRTLSPLESTEGDSEGRRSCGNQIQGRVVTCAMTHTPHVPSPSLLSYLLVVLSLLSSLLVPHALGRWAGQLGRWAGQLGQVGIFFLPPFLSCRFLALMISRLVVRGVASSTLPCMRIPKTACKGSSAAKSSHCEFDIARWSA